MSYNLIWEPNGVYWKYFGKVSGIEVLKATMLAYGNSRFDEMKYKLVDFLNVEGIEINERFMEAIANRHKHAQKYNPHIKNAIVVRSKTNKLANFYSELFNDSSWDVRVFDDLDEANIWLDRQPTN